MIIIIIIIIIIILVIIAMYVYFTCFMVIVAIIRPLLHCQNNHGLFFFSFQTVPITFNPIRFVWKWLELPTCAGAFPKLGNKFQVQIGFTLNQIVAGRLTERMNHTGDPKKETLLFNQKIRPHILK